MDEKSSVSDVRRKIVTIGGSAFVATVLSPKLLFGAGVPYPSLQDSAPPVDGFFFIIPGKDNTGDPDEYGDRVFFISSSWLPFFELTDQLTEAAPRTANVEVRAEGSGPNPVPIKVYWQNHQLGTWARVTFLNDGPDPIMAGTPYYVRNPITDEYFHLGLGSGGPKLEAPIGTIGTNELSFDKYAGKRRVFRKFKGRAQNNWSVLYSDDVRDAVIPNTSATVVPLEDPREGTYLAMQLSPSL